MALERQEKKKEDAAQAAWVAEARQAADGFRTWLAITTLLEGPRC
jgi:hypothetical protein